MGDSLHESGCSSQSRKCEMLTKEHRIPMKHPAMVLLLTSAVIASLLAGCAARASTPTPVPPTSAAQPPRLTPVPPMPSELARARQALGSFFSLLYRQRHGEAVNFYSDSYDVLRDWNPTVDYATLLKNECTINGLVCLRIGTIVDEKEVSPTEFRSLVEFVREDGSLFELAPSETQFPFTIGKVDGRFLVQDLPVYMP